MKHKGTIKAANMEEMFQGLSEENASGTLLISSPVGEKRIILVDGEVIIHSNNLSERVRIGDLLIGRNKITEAQLMEALRIQKQEENKMRIGDLLVSKGFISQQDVQNAVKFQLEEEICEVFTWPDVSYEFEKGRKAATVHVATVATASPRDTQQLSRLTVDPQTIIKEATRRAHELKQLSHRLSSPYLCFRLSALGMERFEESAASYQRLLKLIREGRTLESVVKLSYQGRLAVYQSVIRMLDDGLVIPYPSSELRYLASEHRAQGRFADALHIYRRLLDNCTNDRQQVELERLIEDTTEAILKAKTAGIQVEGFDAVRHKEAAKRYFRKQRIKRILLAGVGIIMLVVGVSLYLRFEAPQGLSQDYVLVLQKSEEALSHNRYEDALELWHTYYYSLSDHQIEFANQIKEKYARLIRSYNRHVDSLTSQARILEDATKFDEAKVAYEKILKDHPHNHLAMEIRLAIDGLDQKKDRHRQGANRAVLQALLDDARKLESQKLYERAKEAFADLAAREAGDSEILDQARAGVHRLQAIAGAAGNAYQTGLSQIEQNQADEAIDTFESISALTVWPELDWVRMARTKSVELRMKRDQIRTKKAMADAAVKRGAATEAVEILKQVHTEYPQFKEARDLKDQISALMAQVHSAEQLLEQAQAAEKKEDWTAARSAYGALLQHHARFLTARKVEIPVEVKTFPRSAQVEVNGDPAGTGPLRLRLEIGKVHTLKVSHPGFSPKEKILSRFDPDELSFTVELDRSAYRVVQTKESIWSSPLCHAGRVYVASGTKLMAFESGGEKKLWETDDLVDASTTFRPSSNGLKQPTFVDDRTWWYLRSPPVVMSPDKLLIATRGSEIHKIDLSNGRHQTLFKMPVENVDTVGGAEGNLLDSDSLFAVSSADGNIRVFDTLKRTGEAWSKPLDSAAYPECGPICGVLPAGQGNVVTATQGGVIRSWGLVSAQSNWQLALGTPLKSVSRLQDLGDNLTGRLCAFISTAGDVYLVDLFRGKKGWEWMIARTGDAAASATIAKQGVYILTAGGRLLKFPKKTEGGRQPEPIWQTRLDGSGVAPVVVGDTVFAATVSGNLHALSDQNGETIWKYKCESEPTQLAFDGPFLYVATTGGQLIIFKLK